LTDAAGDGKPKSASGSKDGLDEAGVGTAVPVGRFCTEIHQAVGSLRKDRERMVLPVSSLPAASVFSASGVQNCSTCPEAEASSMRPPSGVMCSAWGRCSLGKSIYCPSFHSLAMPPSEFPTSLMVSSSRSNRSMLLLAGE